MVTIMGKVGFVWLPFFKKFYSKCCSSVILTVNGNLLNEKYILCGGILVSFIT